MDRTQLSDPAQALTLSQKAPIILSKSASVSTVFPFSLLSSADTPDTWAELEQLFYACLRTGDDKSAHLCLSRLTDRFGVKNERVMALRGLYQEAEAKDEADLKKILEDYNTILSENPMNIPVHKRRVALVRSMGRQPEALATLAEFLGFFPTDVEAWCELSDLYLEQGLGAQATFCLEEALLSVPNAWNIHARLGELEYMTATSNNEGSDTVRSCLEQSIRRFSRSIELCDDYVRGYYGLKTATEKLLQLAGSNKSSSTMSPETVEKLNSLATSKLRVIVQKDAGNAKGSRLAELIAAQQLLGNTKP